MNTLFAGSWNPEVMPTWLGELCKKMVDDPDFTAAKKNIRLTILRLLLNQPVSDIVKPWVSHIMGPILQICLRDLCQDGSINYFLREVVLQFNESWSSVNLTPSLAQLSSNLFSLLFQNLYDDDSKTLSMNLKAVQNLMQRWLPCKLINDIEFLPILELISAEAAETGGAHGGRSSYGMESVRKRITGLEILKVVLQNSYPFVGSKSEACFTEQLLRQINLSIRYPRKEVYDIASVVAGLALHYLKTQKEDVVDLFKTSINETVLAKLGLKDGADMTSSCLRNITNHFPSFLTRETFLKVHCELRRMKSRAKAEFVETITITTSEFDGISFLQAMKPYILSFLADLTTIAIGRGRNVERFAIVQMNTLKFLISHVAHLDFSIISSILTQGQGLDLLLTENTPINIRELSFKFLMLLFNEHILGKPDIEEFLGLKRRIKLLMLRGLIDPDTEGMAATYQDIQNSEIRIGIRRQVYDFFNLHFGLSEDPICRLKDLISDLYDSSNADQWLYYAAFLLLLSFESVNDSEKMIFTKGLADESSFAAVDFSQNVFDHTAESLDPMIPLFALERTQTQNLCVVEDDGSVSVLSQVDLAKARRGHVRQTQKSSWTQTQTQTQGFTQRTTRKFVSDVMSTQLLLGATRVVVDSKKQKYDDSQSTSYPTTHIKQKRSVRFADDLPESKAEDGSALKEFQWKRPNRKRTEVPMYRKYRQGELPDLAIKLSDILKPLQALCLRDGRIGAHVFQNSFSSIYTHLSKKMEPAAVELSLALKNMIINASLASVSNTDFVCSMFTSAFRIITTSKEVVDVLDIQNCSSKRSIPEYKFLDTKSAGIKSSIAQEGFIPADVVSNLAIASKNIYSGIHLLEEQLCISKTLEMRQIKCNFLELSRLYSVLKEQDVISGISAKISPSPETQRALDFEAEGRFEDAVEVYNGIIEDAITRGLDVDAYSTDVQFWNTRSLDCQQQLLNWADLESNIQKLVLNAIEVDSLSMNINSALMKHRSSRDNYLQKYLSCISHGEFSSTVQESFLASFSSLDDQYKPVKFWIESKCSPDLALLHARMGDWSRCRYFVEHALDQFLADWISTSSSSTSAKRALLQNLQRYNVVN
jgi:DNA-dependent protein kinase catalytic subunit